ncbi:MAG TPA: hypothetical protein VGA69_06495 [Nitriliruptorales bacterium]
MRRLSRSVLALATVLALASTACGDDEPTVYGVAGSEVAQLQGNLLPNQILGLNVAEEDVAETLELIDNTYVDQLSVYSFRLGELLQATLQVGHFGADAGGAQAVDYWKDRRFRLGLVNNIGGSAPREVRLGGNPVWLTTGTNQQLSIWFHEEHFFVLATRADFTQPRSLLRELLEVTP